MSVHNLADPVGLGPQRLAQLGLSEGSLKRVLERAVGGYLAVTRFHPKAAGGLALYSEGTAALRQVTAGERSDAGWEYDEEDGQPRTFNRDSGVVVVVSTGDGATGVANLSPSTRNPKGTASYKKVAVNSDQLSLWNDESLGELPTGLTWWLLLSVHDKALYAELSLPRAMGADGRPTAWRERILLTPLPLDDAPIAFTSSDGSSDEIDINVNWRTVGDE